MTVETKTDPSEIATSEWTEARQHGECRDRPSKPEPLPETDQELVFSVSPPAVSWPRVFPGL